MPFRPRPLPWRDWAGEVVPAPNRSVSSKYYLGDGATVVRVRMAMWRDGGMQEAEAGAQLWKCASPLGACALMVPETGSLYWGKSIRFTWWAKKLQAINNDAGERS